MEYSFRRATSTDTNLVKELLKVFEDAFEDTEAYGVVLPSDDYLKNLLSKRELIVLISTHNSKVVGGLVAYVLEKFEKERKEIYIYDLAVDESHRRKGVATGLINELKLLAKKEGAYSIYVQADHGDEPAIKLYESLGIKENVYHFDINV